MEQQTKQVVIGYARKGMVTYSLDDSGKVHVDDTRAGEQVLDYSQPEGTDAMPEHRSAAGVLSKRWVEHDSPIRIALARLRADGWPIDRMW